MRVLEIGCGEGAVCEEVLRRGAAHVVGIERDAPLVESARERVPEATILHGGWQRVPDETFDLVLVLGELDREQRPRDLMQHLLNHLSDDGLLILEVSVVAGRDAARASTQGRSGTQSLPTPEVLYEQYLDGFATRVFGRARGPTAEFTSRWVVHCRPRKPIVVVITGRGYYGKSTLVQLLAGDRATTVGIDTILRKLCGSDEDPQGPLSSVVDRFRSMPTRNLSHLYAMIREAELGEELADVVCDHVPLDEELVIIEGWLRGEELAALLDRLERHAIVWTAERLASDHVTARIRNELPEDVALLKARLSERRAALDRRRELLEQKRDALRRSRAERDRLKRTLASVRAERDQLREQLNGRSGSG